MATLALPPTAAAATLPTAREDPNTSEKIDFDVSAADQSDIDSGWVFLGESDVVPADTAAAAAAGRRRLGFTPLPMLPIWVQMVLGGVVYTAVPFYNRARQIEDQVIQNVETALEVLEHAAEVTEKLAANVASSLPEDGSLHKVAEEIEYIAEVVDKDAQKVEVIIKKIELISDQIDAAVEPVIEELEKDFNPTPAPDAGSDSQK
ncbi:uncharacterized protein LOC124657108 [Lolium rigidum]|uniref:uncharacterized protein LOC124657108 n=1 Tax=Lolium rigidum TaxID=89674 RepID=UPI001F5D5309|nr:uncharacterized protein LOC124657108 [Lolium rigidum]